MNYLGCSGWFYSHWKGLFYPNNLPTSRWFQYYAKFFNTVELNNTFYNFPKISTAKKWYKNSPKDFVYTLKVNRLVTHAKKFKDSAKLVRDFYKVGDALKEKMGCFLFQLPPNMKFNEKKLAEIVSQLDPDRKNVVEFRHGSWFREEVYEEFRKNNVIFCTVSAPELPDDFVKTASDVYIRFHGRGRWYAGYYGDRELSEWARKIKRSKSENAWAYFNNDANAYAVKDCLRLKKILEPRV